jgi:hypothetical protein
LLLEPAEEIAAGVDGDEERNRPGDGEEEAVLGEGDGGGDEIKADANRGDQDGEEDALLVEIEEREPGEGEPAKRDGEDGDDAEVVAAQDVIERVHVNHDEGALRVERAGAHVAQPGLGLADQQDFTGDGG